MNVLLQTLRPIPGLGAQWHGTWVGDHLVAEEGGTLLIWDDPSRPPGWRLEVGLTQSLVAAPSGDRLALSLGGNPSDRAADLAVYRLDGATPPRVIAHSPAGHPAGAFRFLDTSSAPVWSPDSRALAVRGFVVGGRSEVRIIDDTGTLVAALPTDAEPVDWREDGLRLVRWTEAGYEESSWTPAEAAPRLVRCTPTMRHRSPGGGHEVCATRDGLEIVARGGGPVRQVATPALEGATNLHDLADSEPRWVDDRTMLWVDDDATPPWILDVIELRQAWLAPIPTTFVAAHADGRTIVVKDRRSGQALFGVR